MLDIKIVRDNPEIIKNNLKKRKQEDKIAWVEETISKDVRWRNLKQKADRLRNQRNILTEEIRELKKQNKDVEPRIKLAKSIPGKIDSIESEMQELRQQIDSYLMRFPNILEETVPVGKDETENVPIRFHLEPKQPKFELKPHGQLIEETGLANFKKAAKVSGAGFNYLQGELVLLDMALQQFAIKELVKKGYKPIYPPLMLNKEAYSGTTDLEDFEKVMYKIDKEDLYLIATSEHPIVALHSDEVFNEGDLPLKYIGVSPCFRREIGSRGVDTKGLFRMHQFNKVEQFIYCKPEDSWTYFEELQKNSEDLYKKLKIPFRVVNICTGDIGIVAAKKYDIEAWYPREQEYKEVGSCSNCTSYQAVRSKIRYDKQGERVYVHTLNNTAIATSRAMRAIIENFQNKDGTITVPKPLRKYVGKKKIGGFKNG